ncbi:ribosomal protein S18-alanine N-acetyltransferase [Candidatus Bathyarchaeota archaeon]|nr:ribosomal protein S18-alanine N-acetyltransferase [Candidatus Bathyarchaeota archaeon]
MSSEYSIQAFDPKDLDDVVRINWTCLPENYDNAFFLSIFYHFPKTFIVSKVSGKVVGYMMCRVETGFSDLRRFSMTRKGHVVSIAVLPEQRNRGIASALLEKTLEGLRQYQATECFLEVRESNMIAIDLYKRYGFSVTRTMRGYYRDGESAYVMVKSLV